MEGRNEGGRERGWWRSSCWVLIKLYLFKVSKGCAANENHETFLTSKERRRRGAGLFPPLPPLPSHTVSFGVGVTTIPAPLPHSRLFIFLACFCFTTTTTLLLTSHSLLTHYSFSLSLSVDILTQLRLQMIYSTHFIIRCCNSLQERLVNI